MKRIAEFYKALGDETRLRILEMLSEKVMCVCEIIDRLDISQPAVSHHLKILRQAGLVNDSREGKWIYYSFNERVFDETFPGEEDEVLRSFAEPLRRRMAQRDAVNRKTHPELCEELTSKQKKVRCKKKSDDQSEIKRGY